MLGTVGYMSPEQVRGLPTDHRSDLFSFGTVLFEMLTGQRAFKGTTAADTLSAILREDPTETLGTGPGLPPGLLRVVRRCLEKTPDDRFQTARDLAFALEGATTESRAATTVASPLPKRRRLVAFALAAAASLPWEGWAVAGSRPGAPEASAYLPAADLPSRLVLSQFAPDGETIVYSARWGKSPPELFSTRAATRGSLSLGLKDALDPRHLVAGRAGASAAAPPDTGPCSKGRWRARPWRGEPREKSSKGCVDADWSPDGKDLAVIHVVGDRYRLEYPIGRVLYDPEPPTWMSELRISPRGDRVAFVEHPVAGDVQGRSLGRRPRRARRTLASGFTAVDGASWSPTGDEFWFIATRARGAPNQFHAVSLVGPRASALGDGRKVSGHSTCRGAARFLEAS